MTKKFPVSILYFVFITHFLLFFLQQIKIGETFIVVARGASFVIYGILLLLIFVSIKKTISFKEILFIFVVLFFIILKFVYLNSFNTILIYWFLLFYCLWSLQITFNLLFRLINVSAILYFLIALLINLTSFKYNLLTDFRDLDNRFVLTIHRFIGLEGTPAGPDIFYTIVLLFNIYKYKSYKILLKIPVIISIIVIIWTASLSNLVSLLLALCVYFVYRIRVFTFLLIVFTSTVIAYIFSQGDFSTQVALNNITTLRSHIWYQIWESLLFQNTFEEWIFGRDELIKFFYVGERVVDDGNPHNLYLFDLQFLGVPLFVITLLVLSRLIYKM